MKDRRFDRLTEEDSREGMFVEMVSFLMSYEVILTVLCIAALIIGLVIMHSIESSCDGVLVRTMWGYECIEKSAIK